MIVVYCLLKINFKVAGSIFQPLRDCSGASKFNVCWVVVVVMMTMVVVVVVMMMVVVVAVVVMVVVMGVFPHIHTHKHGQTNNAFYAFCRYMELVRSGDGEEYSKTSFLGARVENFLFVLITKQWNPPEHVMEQTYPIRVIIPSMPDI